MFPSNLNALLSLILVTSTVTAVEAISVNRRTGKATLGFAAKINELGDLNIVQKDLARVQTMKHSHQLGKRGSPIDGITNTAVNYVAQVGVGSPATQYSLIVDTGSSNTWVGADKQYVKTKSSQGVRGPVLVSYGSGNFTGEEYIDTVMLTPSLVINKQSIGVASAANGFAPGIDGILGVGPTDLTMGTVKDEGTIPTVLDNLYSQGTISEEVLGIYFIPFSDSSSGELTFGGVDGSATEGPVEYVSLTQTYPASRYWGIDQSIAYGSEIIMALTAGIVDTGTTLITIATDAFQKYKSLTGGVEDSATGLLKITSEKYDNLQPLVFFIGSEAFVLTPDAQIWPRALNTAIGGTTDGIYLIVADIQSPSGSGFDFVNGFTFLERFYSVYDTTNRRVGFANTQYTFSTRN